MKYRVSLILLTIVICAKAQTYEIKSETQRVNNVKYEGFSSAINGSYEKVDAFWNAYLKQHGKVRRKRNYSEISEFSVKELPYDTLNYVTKTKLIDSLGVIWLAVDTDLAEDDLEKVNKLIPSFLKRASRDYYIAEEQNKLDESESAAVYLSKNHQKLITNGEALRHELEFTEALKAKLEGQLENAILKIKVLNQQIIDNKEAVDSVYNDLEQVKKVIEAHKESMKNIN